MKPEFPVTIFIITIISAFILIIFLYIVEWKRDKERKAKAFLRGWEYESSLSKNIQYRVKGISNNIVWQVEKRRGKSDEYAIFFKTKSINYPNSVFYFGDKSEAHIFKMPFMQFILKLGSKVVNNETQERLKTISLLQDATFSDVPSGSSKWNYGVVASDSTFAQKIISSGFLSEVDSISLLNISKFPPSVIFSPEGLEIKWKIGSVNGETLEKIIESSLRMARFFES